LRNVADHASAGDCATPGIVTHKLLMNQHRIAAVFDGRETTHFLEGTEG
jgi:hypothetical protein